MYNFTREKENTATFLHKITLSVYCFLFVFFVGLVLILMASTWNNTNDYLYRDHTNFGIGWYDAEGNPVELDEINSNADIYKTLPETTKTQILFISLKTGNAKVYIDDELKYDTELYETWFLGSTPGYVFVEVEVPAGNSGRNIHVRFENPYNDHATQIDDVYFGDGQSIFSYKVRQLLAPFCLGALMTAIGVVFILFFFVLKSKFDNANKWVYIGFFAVITGIFVIMDSKMLHLAFGHSAIWHIIIEISLMMIPIPITLYFIEEFGRKKKIYPYIIIAIDLLEIIINLILNLANVKEYHQTVIFTHLMFSVVCVLGIYIVGSAMIKDFKHHIYDFIGLTIMIIGGITDLILYYTKSMAVTYIYLRIGIFGFLVFSGVQVISSLMSEYENAVKGDVIRRLAYHDGLTDLYNRTSFTEEMEALDKKNGLCVLLAVFDVNNLKAVNDTLGHAVGDNLISSAAKALSAGFGEIGKVYRIGGDEFVVIITGDLIRDKFEKGLEIYEASVKETNQSQKSFTLSVAVGVDSNVISESCNANKIFENADAVMYEHKKEMKKSRKS